MVISVKWVPSSSLIARCKSFLCVETCCHRELEPGFNWAEKLSLLESYLYCKWLQRGFVHAKAFKLHHHSNSSWRLLILQSCANILISLKVFHFPLKRTCLPTVLKLGVALTHALTEFIKRFADFIGKFYKVQEEECAETLLNFLPLFSVHKWNSNEV